MRNIYLEHLNEAAFCSTLEKGDEILNLYDKSHKKGKIPFWKYALQREMFAVSMAADGIGARPPCARCQLLDTRCFGVSAIVKHINDRTESEHIVYRIHFSGD